MRRLSLLLIFLSLALTACGQSKPTNYYLLKSTAAPVAAESMPRTTLGIVGVNLPGYLDRAGIVLLDENGTLINVPQFNKWAESLDEGAARLLRRSLTPVLLRQGITEDELKGWFAVCEKIRSNLEQYQCNMCREGQK